MDPKLELVIVTQKLSIVACMPALILRASSARLLSALGTCGFRGSFSMLVKPESYLSRNRVLIL